ncbi:hypothetical protein 035JT004_43 [Bacillus phage 035JT004]|nr:hypothetical protein 035JT004_43 [Bacillus phage 035JT004]
MTEEYVTLNGYNDRTVKFSRPWLESAVAPDTLEDFLSEYTWDDTEYLERRYLNYLGQL